MNAHTHMPWRLLATGVAVIATSGGAVTASAPPAQTAADSPLKLVAAAKSVTLTHSANQPVWFEPGVHVVAGEQPFEIWARRDSYALPIRAEQAHVTPEGKRMEPLPDGLVTSLGGLPRFTHLTLKNKAGATVLERDEDFCPNNSAVRGHPSAPASSPYPEGCSENPFALGSVWGIQQGWGVPAGTPWWQREPVDLPDGTYSAEVRINTPYAQAFGIPVSHTSATVAVDVRTVAEEPPLDPERAGRRESASQWSATGPRPAPAAAPGGKARSPEAQRPDLRVLPVWGVQIGAIGDASGHDRLSFNATVWTAGRSPLVVEGFRRAGEDVMEAHQYFYDEHGNELGHEHVGAMSWDDRDGHQMWTFADLAVYRLLDARQQPISTITADTACILDTDAIDHTIELARWQPGDSEPRSACGDRTSLGTRGVLNVGSGFTQVQLLPDQTFDITDQPNGVYYLQASANPNGRLLESDTTNNVSLRKIILGGRPGARTVDVPPYEGIVG